MTDNFYVVRTEMEQQLKCDCKCHFGGAVSCPGCKEKHQAKHECKYCT